MRAGPAHRGVGLNWGIVAPVVGVALLAAGVGMLACLAVALAYGDGGAAAFGLSAALTLPLGALGLELGRRLDQGVLRARDGYFAVTSTWLLAAVFGAVPFILSGSLTSPVDAFFESMSGFTGCGATLLDDVEAQPHSVLLWRSLTHLLGGVGIVVLVVAVAPATGLASQRVFAAESSGPGNERVTPRIADTAKVIVGIYVLLSALAMLAYAAAGMGAFDAVNHAFATLATGGYSTRTASIGAFDSLAIELVAIVFMVLGGINLAFYWRALRGDSLWPQLAEVRAYLGFLLVGVALVTASLVLAGDAAGPAQALRGASFAVVSTMTGTGFVTTDFDTWNDFARLGLLALMFVGGCAGSTSGGMKVIRVMLLGKTALQEAQRQLQPKAVQVLRMPARVFSEDVRRNVLGFFFTYITVWAGATLAMTALGLDLVSASTATAATLNVAGTGFGEVGASENFTAAPPAGRALLALLMLVGRLEVFTVLALLTPAFWRSRWA